MQYKGTLQLFDEMVATGTPEAQARIQAQQLGELGDCFSNSLKEINNSIHEIRNAMSSLGNDLRQEIALIHKDMKWMRIIGAGMIVAFLFNGMFIWLANR